MHKFTVENYVVSRAETIRGSQSESKSDFKKNSNTKFITTGSTKESGFSLKSLIDLSLYIQGGPKKLRQIFLAITLANMDRF